MRKTITLEKKDLTHFVRKLVHKKSKLIVEDVEYSIGLVCGETTLLPCPNKCEEPEGYYVKLERRDKQLTVAYQCYECETGVILEYTKEYVPTPEERLFLVELAKIETNRLESQLEKRIEKNIFDNRVNWDNQDPFGRMQTPKPEIPTKLLKKERFWQRPNHARKIGSKLELHIYRKKEDYYCPGTVVHVIVNNRYLLLGIQNKTEVFIYYGRDDLRDAETNENYHRMVEYVQQLPKPIFFFDYDYKIFGDGMKEGEYILLDHVTGIKDITAYGMTKWEEELQEEMGPRHFITGSKWMENKGRLTVFYLTLQGFELVLAIKRRMVEEFLIAIEESGILDEEE